MTRHNEIGSVHHELPASIEGSTHQSGGTIGAARVAIDKSATRRPYLALVSRQTRKEIPETLPVDTHRFAPRDVVAMKRAALRARHFALSDLYHGMM